MVSSQRESFALSVVYGDSATRQEVALQRFTKRERIIRAILRAGIMLLGAAVVAVIPIVHFLLFPLALIAVVVIFITTYRIEAVVLSSTVTCPSCKEKMTIYTRPLQVDMTDTCEQCHREIELKIIE